MIRIDNKDWSKANDKEKMSYCDSLLKDAKSAMEKMHVEWYLNQMFEDGNHYLTYNAKLKEIQNNPPKRKGEVRMVVNKVRSSKRAIQNYVTGDRPKWEITPGDLDENTVSNARKLGKAMDYVYRSLHLESMVNGIIDTGLNTSVGVVEIDWDPEASGGQGNVRIRNHDPFDVWVDRRAYLYAGRLVSRFAVKTPSRSLDEIKSDPKYIEKNRKKVKADDELAVSNMKAKIIRKKGGLNDAVIKRATVNEFLLWDDEKNDKGGHITLFTYGGGEVLREEALKDPEYQLYFFQQSMNPLKVYQRAWMSDAVPLNKALDRSISQKIMYINQALVYRIIAEKGHGSNKMTNETGQIIEINKGRNFQQMVMNPLPSGIDSLSGELSQLIEDVLGAHDASFGRLPAGARSGKTLEALQAADANNLTGLTQSLESFLSVIGKRTLDLISEKYVASRIIKIAEPEDGEEFIRISGSKAPKREDTTIVTKDNEIIVKIGSWLGHTREAQRETIIKLAELGVLDGREVLRQFEFPNVEELSEKARSQRLEEAEMQLEIAGRTQGDQGGAPEEGIDMVALADKENMAMAQGEQVPPTEGATPDHSQAHRDFIQSKTGQNLDQEILKALVSHYQGEVGSTEGV
jgi:hypothetical protein